MLVENLDRLDFRVKLEILSVFFSFLSFFFFFSEGCMLNFTNI